MSKDKLSRCNDNQRFILICFMEAHPELVRNRYTATFTAKAAAKVWEAVAEQLNSIPGPKKRGKEWKATWRRLCRTARALKAQVSLAARGTVGGKHSKKALTDAQTRVIALLEPTIIKDHSQHSQLSQRSAIDCKATAPETESDPEDPVDYSDIEELGILDRRPLKPMPKPRVQADEELEKEPPLPSPMPPADAFSQFLLDLEPAPDPSGANADEELDEEPPQPSPMPSPMPSPIPPAYAFSQCLPNPEPTLDPYRTLRALRIKLRAAEARLHRSAQEQLIALKQQKLQMTTAQNFVANANAAAQTAVQQQMVQVFAFLGGGINRIAAVAEAYVAEKKNQIIYDDEME